MTFQETRAELATAVGEIEGIDAVVPYLDAMLQPRTAVIQLHQPVVGPDVFAGAEWHVFVILDQDTETGDRYLDTILDPLLAVLRGQMSITGGADIVGINVGGLSPTTGATIPALRVRGIRER